MSFILDALRKSEHERQRQGGPGIADIRTVGSGTRLPMWAIALGALLLLNIFIVLVLVFRGESGATTAQERAAPPSGGVSDTATANPPGAPSRPGQQPPSEPSDATSARDSSLAGSGSVSAGGESAIAGGESAIPLPRRIEPRPRDDTGRSQGFDASTPAMASPAPATRRDRSGRTGDPQLSAEPEPEPEPDPALDLPTLAEVAARPGSSLPELHLDIHVYASRPSERFVFLNMRKYREGSSTPEGTRVERITRDGVVLNHRGLRFVMPRQ